MPMLLLAAAAAGPLAAAKPPRLEDMDYDKARAVILGFGWKPFPGACEGAASASTCRRYPEVDYCQLTGRGMCGMSFQKDARCLLLTTVESPPGSGGSTVVIKVSFQRRRCSGGGK